MRCRLKFDFASRAPWVFAEADTPRGAQLFLQDVDASPAPGGNHHRLSLELVARFRDELETVSRGGAVAPALWQEVMVFRACPISEAPAEGYHRDVSRVGSTTASARLPYAFSSLRLRSNLERIVCELKKPGGMHLIAGFWRDFKGVVRIGGRRSIDSAVRKRGLKVTFRS